MKKIVLFTLSLLFFSGSSIAGPLAPDRCGPNESKCIQVGTFNIKWLGTDSKKPVRSKRQIERIADLITTDIDLDLVALQEINPDSKQFNWLNARLERANYQTLVRKQGSQSIVIAFDTTNLTQVGNGVQLIDVRNRFQLPEDCRSSNLRRPVMVDFKSGDFTFTFIGVHLKSQLGGYCADKVRMEQFRDLKSELNKMLAADLDKDIIVAGDFNASLYDPSSSPITDDPNFWFLTDTPRLSNHSGRISYVEPPYEGLIDHVLIAQQRTLEWKPGSTWIFDPAAHGMELKVFLEDYSDHVPVWTSFFTSK